MSCQDGEGCLGQQDDHPDLDDKLRILENEELVRDITYNNARRYVLNEALADYLGAP